MDFYSWIFWIYLLDLLSKYYLDFYFDAFRFIKKI